MGFTPGSPRGRKSTVTNVTVGATPTLILAANPTRIGATIVNNSTAVVTLGKDTSLTTANGYPLGAGASSNPGDSFSDEATTDAWYGIVASGTADVRVIEVS